MVMVSQSMMVVIMCVSCQLSTLFIFTNHYQQRAPYQNHHATGRFRRLPNVTKICARGAKPVGRLGLVYQRLPPSGSGSSPTAQDLYQSLPPRPGTRSRLTSGRHRVSGGWVHSVAQRGEPYTHSDGVTRCGSVSETKKKKI